MVHRTCATGLSEAKVSFAQAPLQPLSRRRSATALLDVNRRFELQRYAAILIAYVCLDVIGTAGI